MSKQYTRIEIKTRRTWLPLRILGAVCAGVWGCIGTSGYEEILPKPNYRHSHHEFKCIACGFKDTQGVDGYCDGCVENGYYGCAKKS